MSSSLWPSFAGLAEPREMSEMLRHAAGDIDQQTNGTIVFHIDTIGVGVAGAVQKIRYNCYLKVVKNNYLHLLFRITTPVAAPFPATAETPEDDGYPDLKDEDELRAAIEKILRRDRTKEVVLYLLKTAH